MTNRRTVTISKKAKEKRDNRNQLALLIKEAKDALDRAQEFADKNGLQFYFGIAHGICGMYYPQGLTKKQKQQFEEENGPYPNDIELYNGWIPRN